MEQKRLWAEVRQEGGGHVLLHPPLLFTFPGPSPHTWPFQQKPPAPLWWVLQFGRDLVMQQEPCQGAVTHTEEEE